MFGRNTAATTAAIGAALALVAGGGAVADAETAPAAVPSDSQAQSTKLKDNKVLSMPKPGKNGDHYRFSATTARWSVIAADPSTYLDVDVSLYSDEGEHNLLKQSTASAGGTDFVAIDSGDHGLQSYYSSVDLFEGKGDYRVEFAQGDNLLSDGFQLVPAKEATIVTVRDTYLFAGKSYRFMWWPTATQGNGDLYLMASDPATDGSYLQSRSEAIRSAEAPAGSPSIIDFTPTRSDMYGLVGVSTGVSSDFGLQRLPL